MNETMPVSATRIISRSTRARAPGRLQGQREHHDVERPVGEIGQALVDIGGDDRDAARHAGVEGLRGDLDALALAAPVADELLEQRAVAAAEVQHPRSGRDHVGDDAEIEPHQIPAASEKTGAVSTRCRKFATVR